MLIFRARRSLAAELRGERRPRRAVGLAQLLVGLKGLLRGSTTAYRPPMSWAESACEIRAASGREFDPEVVDAFGAVERDLQEIYRELAAA
jgi:hypothetical protein